MSILYQLNGGGFIARCSELGELKE